MPSSFLPPPFWRFSEKCVFDREEMKKENEVACAMYAFELPRFLFKNQAHALLFVLLKLVALYPRGV